MKRIRSLNLLFTLIKKKKINKNMHRVLLGVFARSRFFFSKMVNSLPVSTYVH